MNCKNCGAPLTPVRGGSYFVCEFCTTFLFPNLGADGVQVLDREGSGIGCPVCGLELSRGQVGGVSVLTCEKCTGVLTEQQAFRKIIEYVELPRVRPRPLRIPISHAERQRRVVCPLCGQLMDMHPYYGPGNVVIDTCGYCRVIWLDHGELGVILEAVSREPRRRSLDP
jgi:Zn-finger nucleic acid-binding protein